MPDLHDSLENEARRVLSEPGALGAVLERAGRRRRAKRIATGALALVVAGAGFGLAYAAFRPARQVEPGGVPVPGPSVSASPVIRAVIVINHSGIQGASQFASAVMAADGIVADVVVVPSEGSDERTAIYCHPTREAEAIRLRNRFFPGADLRPRIDPEEIEIRVGQDFIDARRDLFELFIAVRSFMTRRLEGSGAEAFLSAKAARQYGSGDLALYEGVADASFFSIQSIWPVADETAVALVQTDGQTERLTAGTAGGRPVILEAELLPPGPYEEVRAFVEGFLKARREASGAGTYLGGDAREAYASHQDGLDLLRYAADQDLTDTRIVKYDRLSSRQHLVVVRFTVQRPDGSVTRTFELLTIEPLDGGFVVADAKRVFA